MTRAKLPRQPARSLLVIRTGLNCGGSHLAVPAVGRTTPSSTAAAAFGTAAQFPTPEQPTGNGCPSWATDLF